MADFNTPNFGFTEPEYNASDDTWGIKLNSNWSSIDTLLQDLTDRVTAAEEVAEERKIRVGAMFLTTEFFTDSDAVAEALGYGEWAKYADGRALVGTGESNTTDAYTWAAGEERGLETHTLAKAEIPTHSHTIPSLTGQTGDGGLHTHGTGVGGTFLAAQQAAGDGGFSGGSNFANVSSTGTVDDAGTHQHALTTDEAQSGFIGSDDAHNNLQPSIGVHVWQRTA